MTTNNKNLFHKIKQLHDRVIITHKKLGVFRRSGYNRSANRFVKRLLKTANCLERLRLVVLGYEKAVITANRFYLYIII